MNEYSVFLKFKELLFKNSLIQENIWVQRNRRKKITILTTLLKVLFYISLFLCHFAVHDADDIAGTDSGANSHR